MFKRRYLWFVCLLALAFHPQTANAITRDSKELQLTGAPAPDDQAVAGNVKAALQNSTSLGQAVSGVNFDVKKAVVTLTGGVATADEKEAIEQAVSKCSGVAQVDNHITVTNS